MTGTEFYLDNNAVIEFLLISFNLLLILLVFTIRSRKIGLIFVLGLEVLFLATSYYFPWVLIISTPYLLFILLKYIKHKKIPYSQAKVVFEGGGIRRGLTPVEAAILVGKPAEFILAISILQLLKKKFIKIGKDTYSLIVSDKMKTISKSLNSKKRESLRRENAQRLEGILMSYEEVMLEYFEQKEGLEIGELDLNFIFKPMQEYFDWRMGGFDKKLSEAYYRRLISRSQIEVRTNGKLFLDQEDVLERNLLWILLKEDEEYQKENNKYFPSWVSERIWKSGTLNIFEYFNKLKMITKNNNNF